MATVAIIDRAAFHAVVQPIDFMSFSPGNPSVALQRAAADRAGELSR
jgi:hypothetical protein